MAQQSGAVLAQNHELKTQADLQEEEAAKNAQALLDAKRQKEQAYGLAIQGVTQTISGAAMAVSAFQSLGSIWKNEDLSFGEKLTSS